MSAIKTDNLRIISPGRGDFYNFYCKLLTAHCKQNHSLLKLFTGLANAAFMAW